MTSVFSDVKHFNQSTGLKSSTVVFKLLIYIGIYYEERVKEAPVSAHNIWLLIVNLIVNQAIYDTRPDLNKA